MRTRQTEPMCVYCGVSPPVMPISTLGPTQDPGEPACGQCAHHPSEADVRTGYAMTTYGRWEVRRYVCTRGHDVFDWADAKDIVCERCRDLNERVVEMVPDPLAQHPKAPVRP